MRAVETGIENASYVEIKSGLFEGESILRVESDDSSTTGMPFGMGGDMGSMMGGGNMGGGNRPEGGPGAN